MKQPALNAAFNFQRFIKNIEQQVKINIKYYFRTFLNEGIIFNSGIFNKID